MEKETKKELKKEEATKKKTIKNYIILIILFLLVIGLTLYLCKWYQVYDEEQKSVPVIEGTLPFEITSADLEHYIIENPSTVIYMCTASDMTCRNYEKDFAKLVVRDNLQESIIYLNLSDADENFVNEFNSKYPYKISLTSNYPALVIFEDGKIKNMIQGTKEEKLTITKTQQFIDINKIGE